MVFTLEPRGRGVAGVVLRRRRSPWVPRVPPVRVLAAFGRVQGQGFHPQVELLPPWTVRSYTTRPRSKKKKNNLHHSTLEEAQPTIPDGHVDPPQVSRACPGLSKQHATGPAESRTSSGE